MKKTYEGVIKTLNSKQFFVFGSNTQGRHGKGSALIAYKNFGAKYGQASGFQGNSYAIITKNISSYPYKSIIKEEIIKQIEVLYDHAREMSDCEFFIAYSGSGTNLNGYTPLEMSEMFNTGNIPNNIIFEETFLSIMPAKIFDPSRREDESISQWLDRLYIINDNVSIKIFGDMEKEGILKFCKKCGGPMYLNKEHEC